LHAQPEIPRKFLPPSAALIEVADMRKAAPMGVAALP
jgi:hypothetical protein